LQDDPSRPSLLNIFLLTLCYMCLNMCLILLYVFFNTSACYRSRRWFAFLHHMLILQYNFKSVYKVVFQVWSLRVKTCCLHMCVFTSSVRVSAFFWLLHSVVCCSAGVFECVLDVWYMRSSSLLLCTHVIAFEGVSFSCSTGVASSAIPNMCRMLYSQSDLCLVKRVVYICVSLQILYVLMRVFIFCIVWSIVVFMCVVGVSMLSI